MFTLILCRTYAVVGLKVSFCQAKVKSWLAEGSPSYRPIHSVLARAQVGSCRLHCRVGEVGMLLGLQPQAGQAGVARVPVHIGAGC